MATATNQTTSLPPELAAMLEPMDLLELVKHWAALRMAEEGLGVANSAKVRQYAFDAAEFARTGQWPSQQAPSQATEGDDMGVSIGNREIHYHQASTTETTSQAAASTVAKGLGKLGTAAAIGAAALGGGSVVGIASYFLNRDAPPVVVQPAQPSVDTDTNAGLRFGPDQ